MFKKFIAAFVLAAAAVFISPLESQASVSDEAATVTVSTFAPAAQIWAGRNRRNNRRWRQRNRRWNNNNRWRNRRNDDRKRHHRNDDDHNRRDRRN
jgi:hypothetical protein